MTETTIRTERLSQGCYQVHTAIGTFEVIRTAPKSETGWPVAWAIRYPGRVHADDVATTLRQAKADIRAHVAFAQEGA